MQVGVAGRIIKVLEIQAFEDWKFRATQILFRKSRRANCFGLCGIYCGNKASFIGHKELRIVGIMNRSTSWWDAATFASKQGGVFELRSSSSQIPDSKAQKLQKSLIEATVRAVTVNRNDNRLEQLLNGFVYELFFKDDLHARGLILFDEAERAGLGDLAGLEGVALVKAAGSFAAAHLAPGARLRTMLSDLASLDVVRIIEGRE